MKTYAQKSSAVRAAKKQFGDDFAAKCQIVPVEGGFEIKVEEVKAFEPAPAPAAPVMPLIPKVAELEAPAPTPAIPAFLTAPVMALEEVPAEILEADAEAEELDIAQNPEAYAAEGMILDALPQDDLDVAALQANADASANAEAVNSVNPLRPRISTTEKPTKKVWDIADSMPGAKRKDVIAACVKAGIAYGTARTQYQHWFKCINDQKVAPLAVIGADGAITIINQAEVGK